MKVAVHAPSIAPGSRLERALLGLAARGHDTRMCGQASAGSALAPARGATMWQAARAEVDVVVGGSRPLAPVWLAGLTRARVVLLGLEAAVHRVWRPLEHWAWALSGGYGVVAEAEATAFLAQVPSAEHERLGLWPADPGDAEPSVHADTEFLERACERSLARRVAGPGRAALFVDRDGTLIAERHHLADPEGVALLPGVAQALRMARSHGHPVVVISNQAGVARGLFSEARVHEVMARLRGLLRAEGVELDAIRFCPHLPDAGCECRKPGSRLLREAAEDLRVSLRDSVMIGDKWIDVAAGHAAGASGVLVRTGHGAEEARAGRLPGIAAAEWIGDDLPAAVGWFLLQQE